LAVGSWQLAVGSRQLGLAASATTQLASTIIVTIA